MALEIPSYPDPRDPAAPLQKAYGWISALTLDLFGLGGSVTLRIHPREDAWQAQPVGYVNVNLGQDMGGEARYPTLPELMADPEFAAAYEVIGAKLYAALARHPALAGSTIT